MALTAVVSLFYDDGDTMHYIFTTLAGVAAGLLCKRLGERDKDPRMTRADSFMVVVMSWVVFSLLGMIPYITVAGMDVASAFFETMSGFTTTGASTIVDVDSLPHALLFWRSATQWIGGLGIVVFSFALIPVYELKNSNIYSAEVSGFASDKVRPKIGATARRILLVYLLLTMVCAALYWAGPMNLYDAVCHAFTTMSTGGFSTHTDSIAHFHSSYIEYVAGVFMLMGSVNYTLYYYLSIRKHRIMTGDEELRTFLAIAAVSVAVFMVLFYKVTADGAAPGKVPHGLEETFRTVFFHVSSTVSGSGFAATNTDYVAWEPLLWMPTLVLMSVGGCAGSTAGGLKVVRAIVGIKSILNEFIVQLHPRAVLGVRVSGQIVPADKTRRTLAHIVLYVMLVVAGMLCFRLFGNDVDTALGCSVSMLSNAGPGIGANGPAGNYAEVSAAGKWMLSFYMLVGRLEIFTVLFLFMPQYWKERK